MRTVIAGPRPPEIEALIEQRQQLGLDRHDEVWDGDYHMAPGPTGPHGAVAASLVAALYARARAAGLRITTEFNIGAMGDFRVPDVGLHRGSVDALWFPTAAIVIEVLSPGDETFEKFGFYARHGVEELLVADPDARTVRIWQLRDRDYVETGVSALLGAAAETIAAEIDWP